MSEEMFALLITSASIGFVHTLFGPDHYLPFIMMSRAQGWSKIKTAWVTFLSGLGHVLSSVVLGLVGVAFGIALFHLEDIESVRGDIAAWMLFAFGLAYMIWGVHRLIRKRAHTHVHTHPDGESHEHAHSHRDGHLHPHTEGGKKSITPWVIFTIFLFGPCEPLIPVLMYPAAQESVWGMVSVALVFSVTTIGTMMAMVFLALYGFRFLPLKAAERYTHVIAGGTIALCACAILFLGL